MGVLYYVAFFVQIAVCLAEPNGSSVNPMQECLSTLSETHEIFEVLPGAGWDNLRNVEGFRVFDADYKKCQITADQKFLVPDGLVVEPVKTSEFELFAESFDDYIEYKSATAASINLGSCKTDKGDSKICGSFSKEAQFAKTKRLETNSSILRITARFPRFLISLGTDAPMNEAFRERLHKIGSLVEENQNSMAKFESEQLVRDFGTNIISSILVGGSLVLEDYVSRVSPSESFSTGVSASMRMAAGEAFNNIFLSSSPNLNRFGVNGSRSISVDAGYSKRLQHSKLTTYGGGMLSGQFDIKQWETDLEPNLVAIDRFGNSIVDYINPYTLPEVKTDTVYKIESLVAAATNGYYEHNTVYGCTDPESSNFNSLANMDDGTCGLKPENFMFGGFYQTCYEKEENLCHKIAEVNPRTDDYTCPAGYRSVLYYKVKKSYAAVCHEITSLNCLFCNHDNRLDEIELSVFWCAPNDANVPSAGFLFGGLWNPYCSNNRVTCSDFCPFGYTKATLGLNINICYAEDTGSNRRRSLAFGGMYSSMSGNPIAKRKNADNKRPFPKKCPAGFSSYMVSMDEGNELYYCGSMLQSKAQANNLQRPPFMKRPLIEQTELTNSIIKMTDMQQAAFKIATLSKSTASMSRMETAALKYRTADQNSVAPQNGGDKPGSSSSKAVVIASIVGGVVLVAVIAFFLFKRSKKTPSQNSEYTRLSNDLKL